jgi:hypothetical protein
VVATQRDQGGGLVYSSVAVNQITGRVYVVNDQRAGRVTVIQDDGPAGARPVISRLSPPAGRRGVAVTITGGAFGARRGGGFVTFAGKRCGAYLSWTDTRIRCRVPGAAPFGAVRVKVTTSAGPSNARTFSVRR